MDQKAGCRERLFARALGEVHLEPNSSVCHCEVCFRFAESHIEEPFHISKFHNNSGAALGEMPYFFRSSSNGTGPVLTAFGCALIKDA